MIYGDHRNEQRDLLPGTLEMLILQTLRRGALHGYAISQYIQQTSEEVLQVGRRFALPGLAAAAAGEVGGRGRNGDYQHATGACVVTD